MTLASATPDLGRRLNRFVNFLRHDEILALLNVQELTRSLSGLLDCPIEFAAGVLRAGEGSLGIGPIPWTMLLFVVFIGLRGRAGVIATMIIEAGTMSAATSGQLLWKIKMPLALPVVLLGGNQTILYAMFIAILETRIGGVGGLAGPLMSALGSSDVGNGTVLGLP